MSARSRKLQNQSEVTRLVKNLDKRMEDFEFAVEELKNLKETLVDLNEEIVTKEEENKHKLTRLGQELKENRIRIINESAAEQGKILISTDELNELKGEPEKLKAKYLRTIKELETEMAEKITKQLEEQLKVQALQHNVTTAQIEAENTNLKKEIENLNSTIKRMSEELESQKKLTADVAKMNRPVIQGKD